ncbi:hypothetical protein [Nitrosospira sp. Nsp1]|uniref:hypothetical protein n=1 Tax=Nitrosospira sp. Nsp1 TaxID=136547 RepID=UPI0008846FCB|nr:hypothetical protein [Nitrosospira sp. Nsp1]SCX44448.1 hypothetical protein SAMN05720354_105100 [Nitrosospira sp. Nsp1]
MGIRPKPDILHYQCQARRFAPPTALWNSLKIIRILEKLAIVTRTIFPVHDDMEGDPFKLNETVDHPLFNQAP